MTICIAAICTMDVDSYDTFRCSPGQEVIIGISDRMISSENYQVEFPLPKYAKIVESIVVSSSGSADAHYEIFENTKAHILKELYFDPKTIPVKNVAKIYCKYLRDYADQRKDGIARFHTSFDYKNFLRQESRFDFDMRRKIYQEISELAKVEAIVTGIDEDGPHLYKIEKEGYVTYEDEYGFSMIGSGCQQADYEITKTVHTRKSSFRETLIRLYMAKKRAELDPFVGKDTDIFITFNDYSVNILPEDSIKLLDDLYNDICSKQEQAIKEAGNTLALFLSKDNKIQII